LSMAKKFRQKRGFTWISFFLLIAFIGAAVFCLFPLYAMFVASFKPGSYLVRAGLNVDWDLPVMNLNNYKYLFTGDSNYFVWYRNSIIVTFLQVSLCLFLTSMVGFSLAMYRYKGRNTLFIMVMLVMMVPVEILLLGLYQLFIKLGLMNTYMGAILPFVVAPIAIFFFQQYLSGLPKDFMEAARIDGCTEYGIFFRIFMPLLTPAYAAMLILQAMSSWNNFLWPMMVLRTSELQTLPIGLRSLITPYGNNYDMLIAGSVLMVLPILLVYVFFQRYFLEGMTAGGIKG
jgi:arabinosaccharide transport system permease protein